jgi:hypothetical protein
MTAERYKKQSDEEVLLKGDLTYRKSKWGFVSCQGILTTKRLVLGKKLNPMYSIIPRLYVLIRGKKIVFQIPLEKFHSIRTDQEELRGYFIVKSTDGTEYAISSTAIFGAKNEDWIEAIKNAVKGASPAISVRQNSNTVEFVRG